MTGSSWVSGMLERIDVAGARRHARRRRRAARLRLPQSDRLTRARDIASGSGYCPASVATSFQLGSREETSRAKVQTSVTSVTLSGLPSITLPVCVARDRDQLRHEAHRDLRGLAAQFGADDVGLVDRHEAGLGRLALGLALADRGLEAVIDLARQQILQRAAVAFGKGGDDHLVGGAGAGDEMLGVEARIVARRWRRGRPRPREPASAMPFQRSAGSTGSAGFGGVSAPRPGSVDHIVVGRAAHARRGPNRGHRAAARGRCAGRARCAGGGK